jgi:small subunit ribosomal protein S29
LFKPQDYLKIFPVKCFGRYFENDLSNSKVFSLACTAEGAFFVNTMRQIQSTITKPFDMIKFVLDHQNTVDFEEAFVHLEVYHGIYRLLAADFREAMMRHRGSSFVYNKMGDSFLFDSLLHVLMRHLSKDIDFRLALADTEIRKSIFTDIMDQILERSEEEFTSLAKPGNWLMDLKYLTFNIPRYEISRRSAKRRSDKKEFIIDLRGYNDHLKDLPTALSKYGYKDFLGINSGAMLYGDRGSGKSGVLAFVTAWAWKNNWVVIKIPSVHRLTQEEIAFKRHEETRLYLQPQLATEFLDDLVKTNEHLLAQIPVDLKLYGFYNFTGCHEDEPIAVQNTYDEWTQSNLFDSDKFLLPGEHQGNLNEQRNWKTKLKEKLPQPKTVLELCKFAEKEPDYTTNIIAEVIEQLQNQEAFPVFTAVDDYNYFFRRSVFPSFRYDNKKLKGFVPPYHMSLCRFFMKMDGHKFKNGFKLVASSNFHLYKHLFTPEKIDHPLGFSMKLEGVKLDYFRNAVYHYTNLNLLKEDVIDEHLIQQYYVESQGNWGILNYFLYKRYNCIDMTDFKFDKRKFLAEQDQTAN